MVSPNVLTLAGYLWEAGFSVELVHHKTQTGKSFGSLVVRAHGRKEYDLPREWFTTLPWSYIEINGFAVRLICDRVLDQARAAGVEI